MNKCLLCRILETGIEMKTAIEIISYLRNMPDDIIISVLKVLMWAKFENTMKELRLLEVKG